MAKTLLTIIGALLVTVVSLLFLRKDLSKSEEGTSPSSFSFFPQTVSSTKMLTIGEKSYRVVVVDTPEKREKGLSGTDRVPEQGMLFVFDRKDIHHFWMKDMKYDLDFIWIADEKVVDFTENVPHPDPEIVASDLPVYSPTQPASMMLEVPAGFVKQEGIAVGDSVQLQ